MAERQFNWLGDLGLLLIRLMLGVVFVYHGGEKLFGLFEGAGLAGFAQYLETLKVPYPEYAAVLAGGAEFLGGLALITGYGVRWMVVPLATTMGVATYLVHQHAFSLQQNGMEYPLTLGVVALAIGLTGPGRISVEEFIAAGKSLIPAIPKLPLASVRKKKYRTEQVATE